MILLHICCTLVTLIHETGRFQQFCAVLPARSMALFVYWWLEMKLPFIEKIETVFTNEPTSSTILYFTFSNKETAYLQVDMDSDILQVAQSLTATGELLISRAKDIHNQ